MPSWLYSCTDHQPWTGPCGPPSYSAGSAMTLSITWTGGPNDPWPPNSPVREPRRPIEPQLSPAVALSLPG